VKCWIIIFLLIVIVWLLDKIDWLKPLLVFTGGGFILLLAAFLISLIIRPGFFRILKESTQEVLAAEKQKKYLQELESQFTSAAQKADSGFTENLLQLAEENDMGDAWFKLAKIIAKSELPTDQKLATEYFHKASKAKLWLQSNGENALLEWEKRLFFGSSGESGHLELITNWEQHHFSGYQRETELAWLYANTKEMKQDFEKAWFWLMLGKARWSNNKPAILPEDLYASLYADLEKRLTEKSRLKLEASAEEQAYREFVSSR
jgi:hypothetical protein